MPDDAQARVAIDLLVPVVAGKSAIVATVSATTQDTKTGDDSTSISIPVKQRAGPGRRPCGPITAVPAGITPASHGRAA